MKEDIISNEILSSIKNKGEYKFSIDNFDAIGIRYTTNYGKELIIIAKGIFMSEELIRLGNIMLITFFIFLIVIAAFGYYFSGHALFPITNTMNELDKIFLLTFQKDYNQEKTKMNYPDFQAHSINSWTELRTHLIYKEDFLSNVSHELRNPLASIISRIQVNLSKDRTIDDYKKCLHSVLSDAVDLEHTSTQLMDFAVYLLNLIIYYLDLSELMKVYGRQRKC